MSVSVRHFKEAPYVNVKHAIGQIDILGNAFHNFYEIYLLVRGDVELVNNHTRQILQPYQLVIIPPGEYHHFLVRSDMSHYERYVLNIDTNLLEDGALQSALAEKELLTLSPNHRIVTDFLSLSERMQQCDDKDFARILTAITTDIVYLIKYETGMREIPQGNLRPVSLQLMNYINQNYKSALDLSAMARECYLSISSLCHIFKEDFGISIKKYILQKRMTDARIALQNGSSPKEVSMTLGFSDYSTFFRAYRAYYGTSPSAFKSNKTNGETQM